jgi:integrase
MATTKSSPKRVRHVPQHNAQNVYYSVLADGSKVYEVRHPPNADGRRLFETIGTRLDAAKARAREVHHEQATAPTTVGTTFGDVVDQWRAARDMRPRSAVRLDSILRIHIEPRFRRVKVREITPPMIQTWVSGLRRSDGRPGDLSPASKRLILQTFSIVLRFAADTGLIAVAPKAPRQRWKRSVGRKRIVSPEEEAALLAYCGPTPWLRPVIRVALHQALRLGEVTGLTWEDVDFGRGKIRIHQATDKTGVVGPTKGGNDKTIMLTPVARDALVELRMDSDGTGFVFPNRHGRARDHRMIQRSFGEARDRADLRQPEDGKICFHSLRHTGISRLANHPGIPMVKVQEFARHANLATTMGYMHPIDDESINDAIAEALTAGAVA